MAGKKTGLQRAKKSEQVPSPTEGISQVVSPAKAAAPSPLSTITDYIAAQPVAIQPILLQIYHVLQDSLPGVEERMSWQMPTFWRKHNIIHFASHKNHVGLYPGPEAIAVFADRLADYRTSKGAIQFPYSQPVPLQLIADIARWCHATGNHH